MLIDAAAMAAATLMAELTFWLEPALQAHAEMPGLLPR